MPRPKFIEDDPRYRKLLAALSKKPADLLPEQLPGDQMSAEEIAALKRSIAESEENVAKLRAEIEKLEIEVQAHEDAFVQIGLEIQTRGGWVN